VKIRFQRISDNTKLDLNKTQKIRRKTNTYAFKKLIR